MFDNFWIALVGFIRIESRVTARATLAQQIPALIQADLELMHTGVLFIVQPDAFGVLRQFVFFLHQLFDVLKKFCIGHRQLLMFYPFQGCYNRFHCYSIQHIALVQVRNIGSSIEETTIALPDPDHIPPAEHYCGHNKRNDEVEDDDDNRDKAQRPLQRARQMGGGDAAI